MSTEVLEVQGMTCGHCERAVIQAVQALEPGAQVEVNLASGRVEVNSGLAREAIAQAIVEEGYTVK